MSLNIENTRKHLQDFDFKTLFIEELGWNNAKNKNAFPFQTKEGQFYRKAIAELSGATVYEITNDDGQIPDAKTRDIISKEIQKINFEHILIFIDKKRSQTVWRWIKKQDKKNLPREHYFSAGQTGDLFIGKLAGLMVDISEIENDITITDVAKKIQTALDVERVTKQFFSSYKDQFTEFIKFIDGIDNDADKRWYASVILNRLMFIYFLQKKGFIDNSNQDYLYTKLLSTQKQAGKNEYYNTFLKTLFFDGFAKAEPLRNAATNKMLGKIKYLNGGLFLKHKIEEKYPSIAIPDVAFENLLQSVEPKGLFERFSWSLDDTPGGNDNEINPDVLGYIFEKYINQKAFGAYYTRTEITEYLCEQTVYKLILDAVNEEEVDPLLIEKTGLLKPLNSKLGKENIVLPKAKHYTNISELLLNLDAATCKKLIHGDTAVIPNLSLLDPACGSGAFLVAAMKTLINVYAAILGKIDFLGDKKLLVWKADIKAKHPSINYYIKKQIITNNLYGVDIMEEATEIAKLRLFLALVASAETVDQLEPLPNIDFNIMSGNSLIGLLRVDANQFNKHFTTPIGKQIKGKIVQSATLFNAATAQANMFAGEHAKSYQQLINEKEAAVLSYKNAHELGITDLQDLRNSIRESETKANAILNQLLKEEFTTLGIKYEQVTWDSEKNKEGKPIKRPISQTDITALEPFHWGYEFSEIFRKKDGFDAIITNPPWEIFKPNSKEFFADFSKTVSKKKMNIIDFEKEQEKLLEDEEIRKEWLEYLSRFPYVSSYFRSSIQYKNQISLVNGKKAGSDTNLYKLFTEQCYNLLKKKGYCGIIIPTGIYTDLGTKQLRNLLFNECKVQELVSFANEKFIFENVHHAFKFCFLSFEKGMKTESFSASFRINPRECITAEDLDSFLHIPDNFINIPIEFIYRQSPESISVMEIRKPIDFIIAEKILTFPSLGEEIIDKWNFKLGSEFHMTSDSSLFETKTNKSSLFLYEGKMMNQFIESSEQVRFHISELNGRQSLLGRNEDANKKLGYEFYRIGLRAISSSTNSRTLISTILPKKVFTGNSLLVSANEIVTTDLLYITSFINSFILDYYIRQIVSQNINMFYIYQLPVPRLSTKDKWYKPIVEKAAKLICTTAEYADLWQEVMKTTWSEKIAATNEFERNTLRAELDGIIAHIYGLTEEEFVYILGTFPIVKAAQKELALAAYKTLAPQFVKALPLAEFNWAEVIQKGESQTVEFKSTLRIDLKTNKPEKFIEHSVLKTLAAFLNSDGGTLLIGIEDNKNIIGLEPDFNSFSKVDKLDEFQKHFDNLISKSIGNRFHRYLKVEFPVLDGNIICAISIKEKSEEAVYIINDAGQETFYIRRQASTIDLKPSETIKYIQEHWKQKTVINEQVISEVPVDMFLNKETFNKELSKIIADENSAYYSELKEHWNGYSLMENMPLLNSIIKEHLPKSIEYGLLPLIADLVKKHLYNNKEGKYLYNQPHIHLHNSEDEGYDMPVYNHIRFIGILYATAILNKIDIDTVAPSYKNMQTIFSSMIEGMIDNLTIQPEIKYEKEYPTNYHWLIGEIFSTTGYWLSAFNEKENFVKSYSYTDFIPFNISLCLSQLYNAVKNKKISLKFLVSQCYYSAINDYFSPLTNDAIRDSMEKNIIANIPNEFIKPILVFSLDEAFAIHFNDFRNSDFGFQSSDKKQILKRLRDFLMLNNKL